MVLDEYDTITTKYEHKIDIYSNYTNDDIKNVFNNLGYDININKVLELINDTRNSFNILNCRNISCIGLRYCVLNSYEDKKWILLLVWRNFKGN